MAKQKKKKKKKQHRVFWFFIKLQIFLMVLILGGLCFYYFGGYADKVAKLHSEAVELVQKSDKNTFLPARTSTLYDTNGDEISETATTKKADYVKFVSPSYSPACFQIRNEYMVNHSNRVIAVYNGEAGGTRNTLNYAKKKSIETIIIEVPTTSAYPNSFNLFLFSSFILQPHYHHLL